MSTLPDSSEITPGQCSFWSLNITVNSILPAGNESFLLCVRNHSAPIFSLFEVQTVCGLGIHLTLRLSLHLKTLLVKSWELQGQELHREKKKRAGGEILSLLPHRNQTASPALCALNAVNAATQLSKYQATKIGEVGNQQRERESMRENIRTSQSYDFL